MLHNDGLLSFVHTLNRAPKYKPKQPKASKKGESRQASHVSGNCFQWEPVTATLTESQAMRTAAWEQQQNSRWRTLQQTVWKTQPQHLRWKSSKLQAERKLQSWKVLLAVQQPYLQKPFALQKLRQLQHLATSSSSREECRSRALG